HKLVAEAANRLRLACVLLRSGVDRPQSRHLPSTTLSAVEYGAKTASCCFTRRYVTGHKDAGEPSDHRVGVLGNSDGALAELCADSREARRLVESRKRSVLYQVTSCFSTAIRISTHSADTTSSSQSWA